jgi:large subunit ribosomal protein L18
METKVKLTKLAARQRRIRSRLSGSAQRPRLSVSFSGRHIRAQLIDDSAGKTLVSVTTLKQKLPENLTERARWTGEQIANSAKSAKISQVVLDRRGKPYHGRVKAFADAARQGGLEF